MMFFQKLEAADIIVSELGHFKDNHTSEQALVNGFMSPITYPNGDQITLAMPPVKMGCVDSLMLKKPARLAKTTKNCLKSLTCNNWLSFIMMLPSGDMYI